MHINFIELLLYRLDLIRHNQIIVMNFNLGDDRSSRRNVFCKKGVLRNFAKFPGKHLCQSLFFNKVAGLGLQLYENSGGYIGKFTPHFL